MLTHILFHILPYTLTLINFFCLNIMIKMLMLIELFNLLDLVFIHCQFASPVWELWYFVNFLRRLVILLYYTYIFIFALSFCKTTFTLSYTHSINIRKGRRLRPIQVHNVLLFIFGLIVSTALLIFCREDNRRNVYSIIQIGNIFRS